jgi:hypothetical protein
MARSFASRRDADSRGVQYFNAAGSHGPHREFRVARHSELSDQKNVERCREGHGDFVGHRYAATRQSENHNVRTARVLEKAGSPPPPGVSSIAEEHAPSRTLRVSDEPARCRANHPADNAATRSAAPGSSNK